MNNVEDCKNSPDAKDEAEKKDFSELGSALVETFLNLGMTEEELRIFILKEKGLEDFDIAYTLRIPSRDIEKLIYATYKQFHSIFKAVNNSEKEFLITLPSTLVKWMDEEIEMRGYESRDDLIRWVMHHHYQELRYGLNFEYNDPLYQE